MTIPITIRPARRSDIPVLAKISDDAFESDKHTEMKSYGKVPYNMEKVFLDMLPGYLSHPKARLITAVEEASGDIMGYCVWGFRGVEPPAFPAGVEVIEPVVEETTKEETLGAGADEGTAGTQTAETAVAEATEASPADGDPVARLEALTSAHLQQFVEDIMPDGTKCLYIVSLSVAPAFQKRGVGSALLRWGTGLVDQHGAFAWVHSSEGAAGMYEKVGFRDVRRLEVDLDEYAPGPAPEERFEGGKWGRYVFRYMVYGVLPEGRLVEC